jgi:hypothetical protein
MSTLAATTLKHASSASNNIVLTSGGGVGIGTSSPRAQTHVFGLGQTTAALTDAGNRGGMLRVSDNSTSAGAGGAILFASAQGDTANSTGFAAIKGLLSDGSGNTVGDLSFSTRNGAADTSLTERMRITNGGNVGIGTSSPSAYGLTVSKASGAAGMQIASGANNSDFVMNGIDLYVSNNVAGTIQFYINSAERARIDSNGNLQIGTTTDRGRATISWNSLSQQGLSLITTSTTFNGNPIVFYNSSAGVSGFIGQSAGSVTYNTSSDYRLKHDVQPLVGGLATVAALKPSTYKWNADNSPGEGFIAHELQAIIPQAVSGEKDAVNDDGSIKPQGVDYSKVVVHLVAAIQELKAEFDAYKAAHP